MTSLFFKVVGVFAGSFLILNVIAKTRENGIQAPWNAFSPSPDPYDLVLPSTRTISSPIPNVRPPGWTARSFKAADFDLKEEDRRYAPLLVAGANRIARENMECMEASPMSTSVSAALSTRDRPVFATQCKDWANNWFVVHFSRQDVQSARPLARPEAITPDDARKACDAWIRSEHREMESGRAASPWVYEGRPGAHAFVSVVFTLHEKSGADQKYQAVCWFTGPRREDAVLYRL